MHSVLLVDDEIYTRKGLRNLIDWEACGFQVADEADNGEDALALIRQLKPDLVITDIRMPVLDGLELIRQTAEEKAAKPSFIIISGYDDFKYAQQAVRYGVLDFILKPIDENVLISALHNLNDKLNREKLINSQHERFRKEHIISSLIKGEAGEDDAADWAQQLGVHPDDEFRYVLVEINDIHPWRNVNIVQESEQLKEKAGQALGTLLGEEKHHYLHEHRNRLGFLLPSGVLSRYRGEAEPFAKELQITLTEQMGTPVYIYVGKNVKQLINLGGSYRTAKVATLYKFIEDGSKVVVYDRIQQLTLNYMDMDHALYDRLIEQIEEQHTEAIMSSIDTIFQEFKLKLYAPEAIKLAIHQCVSGIVKILKNMEIDERNVASLEPMLGWQDLNLSLGELKRLFTDFIMESAQWMAKRRKENMKGGIQKIKSYIESNYSENISLKSIAAQFYLNPVYLGQLFKKTYGVYFNDFLLQIRVNEAKKLLRQTDMRIYEVAEKVGFSNADYFVTQFEKIERMTPTEYRNKLL